MFKRIFTPFIPVAIYAAAEYGKADSCPIDQSPCEDFNIDPETGRPVSDISKILRAQTKYEQDMLYKNLQERNIDLTELTDEQIRNEIAYGKPRLAQSPSELADFVESMQQKAFDDKEQKRKQELENLRIETENEILEEAKAKKSAKKEV